MALARAFLFVYIFRHFAAVSCSWNTYRNTLNLDVALDVAEYSPPSAAYVKDSAIMVGGMLGNTISAEVASWPLLPLEAFLPEDWV